MKVFFATIALSLFALPAFAAASSTAQPPGSSVPAANGPADFAAKAGTGNTFEILSSKLAVTKSQNPAIKAFAQKMIDDHTKAADDMAIAAKAENVTPPTALDPDHQKDLDQLGPLSGVEFDSTYVADQTKAHIDAVGLFTAYSTSGKAGPLKDFAAKTLPTLQMHYQMVMQLPKQ